MEKEIKNEMLFYVSIIPVLAVAVALQTNDILIGFHKF